VNVYPRSALKHKNASNDVPKVDIRSQLALDEVLIAHCNIMQAHRGFEQLVLAGAERVSVNAPV
jgi:hypothetical protein